MRNTTPAWKAEIHQQHILDVLHDALVRAEIAMSVPLISVGMNYRSAKWRRTELI